MAKRRVVHAFSAGGVVFRIAPDTHSPQTTLTTRPPAASGQGTLAPDSSRFPAPAANPLAAVEIVLVGRTREGTWMIPKGTPDDAETPEETALREVREETGIAARIVGELGNIHYWFARRGTSFSKEVRHYLMVATGGDVSLHDHEYDEARWFPIEEGVQRLTYENEAHVVRRAMPMIEEYLRSSRPEEQSAP